MAHQGLDIHELMHKEKHAYEVLRKFSTKYQVRDGEFNEISGIIHWCGSGVLTLSVRNNYSDNSDQTPAMSSTSRTEEGSLIDACQPF